MAAAGRRAIRTGVQKKPQAFVDKGFVFVSTNYRFVPKATVKEMTGDIAKAIRWVHDHAKEYGGDPNSIFVMGHSAGAHLAALVCTDDRYLKAEGLSLSIIKGCVPVDTAVYDVPKQIDGHRACKGGDVRQRVRERRIGPEGLVADHPRRQGQEHPAVPDPARRRPARNQEPNRSGSPTKLKEAGVSAKVVAAEGKTHGTINADLGKTDDKPTQELLEFLNKVLKK